MELAMPSTSPMISLNDWLQSTPTLTCVPDDDLRALTQYIGASNALLDILGHKRERTPQQASEAGSIHAACRALRSRFLELHADWLYSVLTSNGSTRLSLDEIAKDAADRCSGLVPTSAQMSRERACLQKDKEGFEIDQGMLFHALLHSKSSGTHIVETALQPTPRSILLLDELREKTRLDLGSVALERIGHAAHLTINNSSCLNAEDERLVDDLETAADLTILDDAVKVCVLRGGVMTSPRYAGKRVFSAGINLKKLHQGEISLIGFFLRREFGFINKIVHGLLVPDKIAGSSTRGDLKSIPGKPWIGVVDSFAIGGGAQILLALDYVIAATDSYFNLPAAREGLVPGFANLRLSRFVGARKSRQLLFAGNKLWASGPYSELIFDEVVDSSDIECAIDRSVDTLSGPAVRANRRLLINAEEPLEHFRYYAAEFALIQAQRLYSADLLSKVTPT